MESIRTIGFVGGGNMAEALIKGLLSGIFPVERILVSEPNGERRAVLAERYGLRLVAENIEVVRACDLVVLAVKPQLVEAVFAGVASEFDTEKRLISILAGVSTASLEHFFDAPVRVVRAMPNTPALVGCGATALCAGAHAAAEDLLMARHLFESVGMVKIVGEAQMDAVTGLSGSGPAYVFTMIEALADGGVQEGLPRDVALALATQTLLGSAQLVRDSGEHPAVLRDRVCSPGGTTIAAVKALEEGGLRAALMNAVSSAARRSRELGS
jgi:pyrroline-5-carboxylate reductase